MPFTEKLNITQKYSQGSVQTLFVIPEAIYQRCYVLLYANICRVLKSQNMQLWLFPLYSCRQPDDGYNLQLKRVAVIVPGIIVWCMSPNFLHFNNAKWCHIPESHKLHMIQLLVYIELCLICTLVLCINVRSRCHLIFLYHCVTDCKQRYKVIKFSFR
jgi:hypothetical protein